MQEIWVQSLDQEDPPTHSSTLAWRIPWREEPGGLQSMGSHRLGHGWVINTHPSPWSFRHMPKFSTGFRECLVPVHQKDVCILRTKGEQLLGAWRAAGGAPTSLPPTSPLPLLRPLCSPLSTQSADLGAPRFYDLIGAGDSSVKDNLNKIPWGEWLR